MAKRIKENEEHINETQESTVDNTDTIPGNDVFESLSELLNGKPIKADKPLFNQLYNALPRDKRQYLASNIQKELERKFKKTYDELEMQIEEIDKTIMLNRVDPTSYNVTAVVNAEYSKKEARDMQAVLISEYKLYFGTDFVR